MHLSDTITLLSNCTIALCYIAERCTRLEELDACGCLRISNKIVYAFQESLLNMREAGERDFRLLVGGIQFLLPLFFFFFLLVANKIIFCSTF